MGPINFFQASLGLRQVNIIGLDTLLSDTRAVQNSSQQIRFCHILLELSIEVDGPSKEALQLPVGLVGLHEFADGVEIELMATNFSF